MAKYVKWTDSDGVKFHVFRDGDTFRMVNRDTMKPTYVSKSDPLYPAIKKFYYDSGGK